MHELFLTKREEINYNETPFKSELNLSTSKEEDSICISGFSYPAKVDDGECWSHFSTYLRQLYTCIRNVQPNASTKHSHSFRIQMYNNDGRAIAMETLFNQVFEQTCPL